jgi:RNA polymerase sigma factor (sigma-70 family)
MATASLGRLVWRLHQSAESEHLVGQPDEVLLDCFLAGDTSAFEQLVWRHGPAVLAACRKVLSVEADVEDAFQATFLTFLRSARSIRTRGAVGGWLYHVAHRVAVQVLDASARRQRRERRAARTEQIPPAADLSWREACAALHEELDRLPERFRLPLIHCYLQGLSRDEAAKQLGWSAGAVKGRLERGRQLLRGRLARRGITLSVGLLTVVSSPVVGSVPSPRLVWITLEAATSGRRSAAVAALVQGLTRVMVPKRSLAAGLLVAVGLLIAGVALRPSLSAALPSDEPQRPEQTKQPKPPPSITRSGRVLRPDGKPFAGAGVYLHSYSAKDGDGPARATSNQDGTFRFTFKVSELGVTDPHDFGYQVVTTADSFGPGWASLRGSDRATSLTLRLVKDVPIHGRLLDINGKPVVGARVRVGHVRGYADTEAFLQTVREGEFPPLESDWWFGPFPGQPRTLIPGADGRFTLRGIGCDRLVGFQVEGPGIQYGGACGR